MCSREEVQQIMDAHQKHNDAEFDKLRSERDIRMLEIAKAEISREKGRMMNFIGWGGIVAIGGLFYFFGGQNSAMENITDDIKKLSEQMERVEEFMASGERFTTADGQAQNKELREYSDNGDQLILQRVESGFESISHQIEELSNN